MKDDMDTPIEELLPFYTLGALTDEERELVEAYLEEHPEIRAQIEEMEFAASALPYGATPVEPPARLKKALMARVAADDRGRSSVRKESPRPRPARRQNIFAGISQPLFSLFSLLAAAVAITLIVVLNGQVSRLQTEVAALRTALLEQARTVDRLSQALDDVNAKLPQTTPSAGTTVSIGGTSVQPDAHGQLIIDPKSNSIVLIVANLAPLEEGKIYQVWLIEGTTPKSAGLLHVDANGQGLSILTPEQAITSFDALGISIEPEEGSLQPTGDIVMLGELN